MSHFRFKASQDGGKAIWQCESQDGCKGEGEPQNAGRKVREGERRENKEGEREGWEKKRRE